MSSSNVPNSKRKISHEQMNSLGVQRGSDKDTVTRISLKANTSTQRFPCTPIMLFGKRYGNIKNYNKQKGNISSRRKEKRIMELFLFFIFIQTAKNARLQTTRNQTYPKLQMRTAANGRPPTGKRPHPREHSSDLSSDAFSSKCLLFLFFFFLFPRPHTLFNLLNTGTHARSIRPQRRSYRMSSS